MEKHLYQHNEPFDLESGRTIHNLELTYHTAGQYNPEKNNVIWICHAFTANSDPSEWWEGLVGDGKYFNARDHFIICVNMIGSCYGSTGPLSIDPATGKPYHKDFPLVTIRDLVRSMQIIKDHLEIRRIRFAVGFSMGGQKLLEWIYQEDGLFQDVLLGATNAFHSPWGVAFNESQRMAISADSTFGEPHDEAGLTGMEAARSIGVISYRNYRAYCKTQSETSADVYDNYKASSYQQYQGEKLRRRFNAYSYWILSKAMDSHNMARRRSPLTEVLNAINTKTHLVAIKSDYLFPMEEQQFLHEHIPQSDITLIDSDYGHDGFLIEYIQMQGIIANILK